MSCARPGIGSGELDADGRPILYHELVEDSIRGELFRYVFITQDMGVDTQTQM